MERRRVDLEITEFLIDQRKEEYLAQLHKQVTLDDILEVLFHDPHFYVLSDGRRTRFNVLGPNRSGRFLLVAIANVDGTTWRVVTAHWMAETRGKRDYDRDYEGG